MSTKINLVGNPAGLPKVFNAQDENKQTVMLIDVAIDRPFKDAKGNYGTDFVQVRAFPRSNDQGSYYWNTVQKAIESKSKIAVVASRQQNIYEKDGETVYEETNRLEDLNVSGGLNTVNAVGRLSRDAQFFDNVALVTLAVEQDYIRKGETQPGVDHVQSKLFLRSDKQKETMTKHLKKGRLVSIDGALRSSTYEDKNGQTVYAEEIVIDSINPFLAKAPDAVAEEPVAVESAPVATSDVAENPFT